MYGENVTLFPENPHDSQMSMIRSSGYQIRDIGKAELQLPHFVWSLHRFIGGDNA